MSITIEDVQENVDKLMLTIFQSALKSSIASADGNSTVAAAEESGRAMHEAYLKTQQSINCLSGIDRPKEDQIKLIDDLDLQYEQTRVRVLQLETELRRIATGIDHELNQVLRNLNFPPLPSSCKYLIC